MKNKKVYLEALQNVKLASSDGWSETLFLPFSSVIGYFLVNSRCEEYIWPHLRELVEMKFV